MNYTFAPLIALLLAPLAGLNAAEIHVSPAGNDANSGTADKPLATIAAAQRTARAIAGREPVTVLLHGGVYYLPETICFSTADSGSTYAAAPGERPVVSGGVRLKLSWTPYRAGIVQAQTPAGFTMDQLFVNGQRQHMARYPNYDMIPFGRIGIRCVGKDRQTQFARDEQLTLMSLWAIGPSPLMLGGHQPDNDQWTLSLITNDEVLAVNQDPLGKPGVRVSRANKIEVWSRHLADGPKAVGLFNRGDKPALASANWSELKLRGPQLTRDLWRQKNLGKQAEGFSAEIPSHGCMLIRAFSPK